MSSPAFATARQTQRSRFAGRRERFGLRCAPRNRDITTSLGISAAVHLALLLVLRHGAVHRRQDERGCARTVRAARNARRPEQRGIHRGRVAAAGAGSGRRRARRSGHDARRRSTRPRSRTPSRMLEADARRRGVRQLCRRYAENSPAAGPVLTTTGRVDEPRCQHCRAADSAGSAGAGDRAGHAHEERAAAGAEAARHQHDEHRAHLAAGRPAVLGARHAPAGARQHRTRAGDRRDHDQQGRQAHEDPPSRSSAWRSRISRSW